MATHHNIRETGFKKEAEWYGVDGEHTTADAAARPKRIVTATVVLIAVMARCAALYFR
ncbi:MAG: hypothetical protein IIA07_04265 [Proteobacteria bacterium]|nr:hypothetical protein [Pseudomonadota bacterium]